MSEIRIRKVNEGLHLKLKIEAVKQKTTLENLIKKILSETMEKI